VITWRTVFVLVAMFTFQMLVAPRPMVFGSWGWHMFASLMLGISLGHIIRQWEWYHYDWRNRQEAKEEEENNP
jgi:hypothetical protein